MNIAKTSLNTNTLFKRIVINVTVQSRVRKILRNKQREITLIPIRVNKKGKLFVFVTCGQDLVNEFRESFLMRGPSLRLNWFDLSFSQTKVARGFDNVTMDIDVES